MQSKERYDASTAAIDSDLREQDTRSITHSKHVNAVAHCYVVASSVQSASVCCTLFLMLTDYVESVYDSWNETCSQDIAEQQGSQ